MPSLVAEACTVLGLTTGPGGAPPEESAVTAAFKKLAIKWHPDRNPENAAEATQRFAEISAARDLLLDPPVNAMLDEKQMASPGASPYRPSAHSQSLRKFEGDVSDQIDNKELCGKEAVALFEQFGLWAVWKCDGCEAEGKGSVCCRIRKNKYSCMCNHRLREHDAGNGFRCSVKGCPCNRYAFMVQDSTEPHRCRCKHKPSDHSPVWPHACTKCDDCKGFDSPWVCNCGHPPSQHRTCFVRMPYTERAREWVCGGLRGECVALANKFRQRSAAERVAFIQRAAAAKAAGYPSWKAAQRERKLHEVHGTQPIAPATPHAGGASPAANASVEERCPECDDNEPAATSSQHINGGGFDRAAAVNAGFVNSNETTHGLSTAELREKLAAARVGVRPANASDFTGGGGGGPFGLW